ncbi:hypothetical protein SAMN02745136_05716 [Anaerocolumna jejuensis DSM 15929]|uniref:Uncharacterized protein n=1 Tax=Anaerocolumna jejuensis DSM 15929 TaxID=1121322 RepID=A0A1M7DJK5_9FIRM|nr:hypothetical protein SAMN02745136_05716 [Anaerocolumna jejuensis DSM 15929]
MIEAVPELPEFMINTFIVEHRYLFKFEYVFYTVYNSLFI